MSDADSFLYLFSRLQDELNRLITEFMEQGQDGVRPEGWSPNVDVFESENAVELVAEVPGMTADDLKLEVSANLVTLSGTKRTGARKSDGASFERVECPQGAFRRQIALDRTVNSTHGEAWLENGLLHVRFPRIEDQRSRVHTLPIAEAPDRTREAADE